MIVKTLFRNDGRISVGEVEVRLLPGIPQLHLVGLPDAQIRECGIKLKAALRAVGFKWPTGHQIVVNLRPSHFRKTSPGVELAIALGLLKLTGQLQKSVADRMTDSIVYGEFTLDGRVYAPHDFVSAVRVVGSQLLTGLTEVSRIEGAYWQIGTLNEKEARLIPSNFCWKNFWVPPQSLDLEFQQTAAESLWMTAHAGLNVLLAGPQGTGKTTWAEALYALTEPPDETAWREREEMFGDEGNGLRWRPMERPHHSITPLAMVGGGSPLCPGVISRAHGGVLVMDEFLEFDGRVLEALREPVECGFVEHARLGERRRFAAGFQLVGTTNLCPCGRYNPAPEVLRSCNHNLKRCGSVCARLSGPVLDRFDVLILSHRWLERGEKVAFSQIAEQVRATREFARKRGPVADVLDEGAVTPGLNFRRRRSLMRVARALADRDQVDRVEGRHISLAFEWVESPMAQLAQMFG